MSLPPSLQRTLILRRALSLGQTLGPLQRGPLDPSVRIRGREMVRVAHTPCGPVSLWITVSASGDNVEATAWGPGAQWQIEHLPLLLGEADDSSPLEAMISASTSAEKGVLQDLYRRMPGLRLPKTLAVFEALIPTIVEQRVAGAEARRSYRELIRTLGDPAPGPNDLFGSLRVPPEPAVVAGTPDWAFHRFGIEQKRAATLIRAAGYAKRLENLRDRQPSEARKALTLLAGIGQWTAAEVTLVAFGDPDAVSVGDYHIPNQVTWAFTGRRRGDDETMLRLLEPYRGQRGRVIRLIQAAGIMPPRRGPRAPLRDFRQD